MGVATYNILQSLLYFIDRGELEIRTNKLVDQGYTLENWRSSFESVIVDTILYCHTPLAQFLCDPVLCWCALHLPDLTSPDNNRFTLPEHLFTHLGFPECPCLLEFDIYSRFCYINGLIILDYRMTNSYEVLYNVCENLFLNVNLLNIWYKMHPCTMRYLHHNGIWHKLCSRFQVYMGTSLFLPDTTVHLPGKNRHRMGCRPCLLIRLNH